MTPGEPSMQRYGRVARVQFLKFHRLERHERWDYLAKSIRSWIDQPMSVCLCKGSACLRNVKQSKRVLKALAETGSHLWGLARIPSKSPLALQEGLPFQRTSAIWFWIFVKTDFGIELMCEANDSCGITFDEIKCSWTNLAQGIVMTSSISLRIFWVLAAGHWKSFLRD